MNHSYLQVLIVELIVKIRHESSLIIIVDENYDLKKRIF